MIIFHLKIFDEDAKDLTNAKINKACKEILNEGIKSSVLQKALNSDKIYYSISRFAKNMA